MWIARQQLGTTLDVYYQAMLAGAPTLPDAVPTIQVRRASDNAIAYAGLMPISDVAVTPGLFHLPMFLGLGFASGGHMIRIAATIDGSPQIETQTFDIIPGGEQRGQILGMSYFHKPQIDFVVWQAEAGLLLRGKNPRVT